MPLRWRALFSVVGFGLGVVLAIVAAAILERIDGNLLWTIPVAGAFGLLGLFAFDMLTRRRA